jgi:hypothetical protein
MSGIIKGLIFSFRESWVKPKDGHSNTTELTGDNKEKMREVILGFKKRRSIAITRKRKARSDEVRNRYEDQIVIYNLVIQCLSKTFGVNVSKPEQEDDSRHDA